MRKIICFILCFALVFATAVPSICAVEEKCNCKNSPIIYVIGRTDKLYRT